jgi:hemolysin activation/secretion protein
MNRLILILFLALFASESFGQFWDKFKFWKEDTLAHQEGVFIFPLLYYTPDTRFAAGLVGVYYFNTGNLTTEKGRDTRLSYVKLLGDYTQNRQLDIWSSFNIFTNEEKYLFKGELRYRNFPDRYYGVGNNTSINQEEFYSFDLMYFKLLAMRQVREKLFIGLDYQFSYEYNFFQEPGGELASQTIEGWNGGFGSGVGAVVTYDTRDNIVNAYSGMLFEVSTYLNSSYLGGTFNYTNVNVMFNKYWEVRKNHVLALNSVVFMNFGGVPFLDMARVGGDDILRGYARNRFRDNHFAGVQLEYRFPLWWRFGMVVFTGVGDVFRNPSDLSFSNLKYSVGAGIRFAINRKERLNVRFDYGFGRQNNSFYIMLTEAF